MPFSERKQSHQNVQQIKGSLFHGSTDAGARFVRGAEKINTEQISQSMSTAGNNWLSLLAAAQMLTWMLLGVKVSLSADLTVTVSEGGRLAARAKLLLQELWRERNHSHTIRTRKLQIIMQIKDAAN